LSEPEPYTDCSASKEEEGREGTKSTDSVNWNSYNGLILERKGDFDRHHFVSNNAWLWTSESHIISGSLA
jgi:hypothetical protein